MKKIEQLKAYSGDYGRYVYSGEMLDKIQELIDVINEQSEYIIRLEHKSIL